MNKIKIEVYEAIILSLVIITSLIYWVYISFNIPIKFYLQPLFIGQLLGGIFIPSIIYILVHTLNVCLVWYLIRKYIGKREGLVASVIFALSTWSVFYGMVGSKYIFAIFLSLLTILFKSLFNLSKQNIFNIIAAITSSFLIYISPIFIFVPIFLIFLRNRFKNISTQVIFFLIILTPLVVIGMKNKVGLVNSLKQEVTIFSDIGLINTVNTFRGETLTSKFSLLGRVVENRYTYLGKHIIFSTLNQLNPVYYFTSESKAAYFMFIPPILVGFLPFFLIGLYIIFNSFQRYKFGLVFTGLLALPAVLSGNIPDLERLLVILPAIVFCIVLGIEKSLSKIKNKPVLILAVLCFVLIVFQGIVVLTDISVREPIRLENLK